MVRVPGMNLGQNHPAVLLLVVTPGFLLHCFLHCQLRHSCSDLWTSALYLAGGTPSLPPKGPQVLPLLLGLLQVSPAWVPELPPPEGLRDQAGTKTCHRPNPRSPPCTFHGSRQYVLLHQISLRAMVWDQATASSNGGALPLLCPPPMQTLLPPLNLCPGDRWRKSSVPLFISLKHTYR